jgi:ribosomal-protein-alanine N-acetyltransferase
VSGVPPPTERLAFRSWKREDLSLAERLWGDAEVTRFLGGPYTHEEAVARVERELANAASHGVQYWQLFTREGDAFAGCCGLKPYQGDALEIGFQLLPGFWGHGYASEAARAVMAFARDELRASALYAGHHPGNEASARLLRKLGFTCIGSHFFARTALDHPWYELHLR